MPRRPRPGLVDATGTRRRLEALATLGHTGRSIGTAMGRPASSSRALVSSWRHHTRTWIDARTAADVARIYPELAQHRGTNSLVRIQALRAGLLPPEAWTGCDIDDPNATPYSGLAGEDLDDDEEHAA